MNCQYFHVQAIHDFLFQKRIHSLFNQESSNDNIHMQFSQLLCSQGVQSEIDQFQTDSDLKTMHWREFPYIRFIHFQELQSFWSLLDKDSINSVHRFLINLYHFFQMKRHLLNQISTKYDSSHMQPG